jgi:hypothetical protein
MRENNGKQTVHFVPNYIQQSIGITQLSLAKIHNIFDLA